jgi:hypothetical protein
MGVGRGAGPIRGSVASVDCGLTTPSPSSPSASTRPASRCTRGSPRLAAPGSATAPSPGMSGFGSHRTETASMHPVPVCPSRVPTTSWRLPGREATQRPSAATVASVPWALHIAGPPSSAGLEVSHWPDDNIVLRARSAGEWLRGRGDPAVRSQWTHPGERPRDVPPATRSFPCAGRRRRRYRDLAVVRRRRLGVLTGRRPTSARKQPVHVGVRPRRDRRSWLTSTPRTGVSTLCPASMPTWRQEAREPTGRWLGVPFASPGEAPAPTSGEARLDL